MAALPPLCPLFALLYFFFLMIRRPPRSTLFPYTRSSDLREASVKEVPASTLLRPLSRPSSKDRKSTRLNSSHHRISYAVFCLKKKKHIVVHSRIERYGVMSRLSVSTGTRRSQTWS